MLFTAGARYITAAHGLRLKCGFGAHHATHQPARKSIFIRGLIGKFGRRQRWFGIHGNCRNRLRHRGWRGRRVIVGFEALHLRRAHFGEGIAHIEPYFTVRNFVTIDVHPRAARQDCILPGKGLGGQRHKYREETHRLLLL